MTQSQPPPQRDRRNPSLGDMLRSVVVLAVIVGAIVIFTAFLTDEPPDPASADVDHERIAAQASRTVDYELLVPTDLPDGWRSNNARLNRGDDVAWHLGMLTADDAYIGLEQSRTSKGAMVEKFAGDSTADGTTEIGGGKWSVRSDGAGETTFVRRADGVTTLVTGDAPRGQIEDYIASLSSA